MKEGITMSLSKWLITIIILVAVVLGLFSYKSMKQEAQAQQGANIPEMAASVSADEVREINYQPKLKVSGEIQAYKQLTIANELSGKVIAMNAASGSFVKADQVLIELDHSDEDAKLIAAKAQLLLNEQTYKRYVRLQKNKEISEDLVDQAKAAVQIAESNIAVLRTAISKKKITAPFDALVGIHNLEVGQFLDKNTKVLALIGVNEFTWVDFYLPQTYQELALGSKVDVLPMTDMSHSVTLEAEIIAVDPQLSQQSRNLKYRAQISSEKLSLKPHTLLNLLVPVSSAKNMMVVPDLAIIRDALGSYVFILEPEAEGAYRAKKVKVELGDRRGDTVLIESGLSVGQLVATKGAFKLFPGMKVFIAQSAPEA